MMEVSKENNSEKILSEPETNGEKSSENEEIITEEVVEEEIIDKNSGKDEAEPEETVNDKTNENITEDTNEMHDEMNDSENKTEKKNLKRKLSDVLKEVKTEPNDLDEPVDPPKEIIEDENPQKKIRKEEKDPIMSLPVNDVFGKGKRARIPNKRYSDIAISPSVKTSKSHTENGEREKSTIIERIEPELSDISSPIPKRVKTSSIDMGNPNFLKPFKIGWKRELVWRSIGGDIAGKRNGDIYYYSPEGKKLRSMREVAEHLDHTNSELSIEDFTFFKEPLGVNDPEKEVIRDAKIKSGGANTPAVKKAAALKLKKISSPKVASPKLTNAKVLSPKLETSSTPKIASPKLNSAKADSVEDGKSKSSKAASSTTKTSNSSDSGNEGKNTKSPPLKVKLNAKSKTEKKQPAQNKQVTAVSEETSPMVGKKATPRKSNKWSQNSGSSVDIPNKPCQPCSIRCPGVQGFVPTLQCRLCLCLYHNECVGLLANINIPNYVCKNCQLEQGGQNMSTGIAPPPLTPITALQSVTAQPTALPKLQRIPKSPEGDANPTVTPPIDEEQADKAATAAETAENSSILGHVTSWLPQNSRIQVDSQPRCQNEIAEPARPQYVEYLAGRKFLIIPKYNIVSVSPTVGARSSQPPQVHETVDLTPGQTADVATAVKTEPVSPSKPENSQTSESAHPNVEQMEVEDEDVKPLVQNIDLCSSDP